MGGQKKLRAPQPICVPGASSIALASNSGFKTFAYKSWPLLDENLLAIDGAAIPPILKKLQALSVEGGSGGKSDPNEEAHKRGSKSMRDGLVAVGDGKGVDSETAALEAHMSVHALYLLQVPSRISSRHNAIGQLRELMAALGLLQKLQSVGLQHSLTGGLTCMLADESIWRTVLVCVGGIQVSGERQKELELPNDRRQRPREQNGREERQQPTRARPCLIAAALLRQKRA
jgi:hypothetical protein